MEPLNKGHVHTEGIVPYSKVVPYWEVFQKMNVTIEDQRTYWWCFCFSGSTIQHLAVGMRVIQIIMALKKTLLD